MSRDKKQNGRFQAIRPLAPSPVLITQVACRDKWRRTFAIDAFKEFLRDYRAALTEFCAGMKEG